MPGKQTLKQTIKQTIIIGGGISGLTAAFLLKQQGADVLLLEKDPQAGGNIKTIEENGYRMETGPHSFMGSAEYTWKLVDELDMHESVAPSSSASKNRYIFRHEKLKPLPLSPFSFIFTTLLSPAAKFRLMLEPFIPNGAKTHDTAWDFFIRRFGKEAATYIMTPFISGVYAGDVNLLGARAAFAKFWHFEKDSGSMIWGAFKYMRNKRKRLKAEGLPIRRGLFSFKGGLGTITRTLAKQLDGSIETGAAVSQIRRENGHYIVEANGKSWSASSVILATPPPETGDILNHMLPELNSQFNAIPMSPVAMIHWKVRDKENSYPGGFGFLMPQVYDLRVLGTLFPSQLFNDRIEDGWQLFATFYGGMTDKSAMNLDDGQLTELLLKEHRRIFNRELEEVEILRILRYPGAIPQLLPDHPERIVHLRRTLSEKAPGLFLAGNYLTGVGIEHAVESGFHASDEGTAFLSEITGE
jgi:oxygen-dependent protoporphyrinogen oxidase